MPASISRKRSTSVRTSLAALALLTRPRNGRVVLINDAKALAFFVSLKSFPRARIADSLIRTDSSSSAFTSSLTI